MLLSACATNAVTLTTPAGGAAAGWAAAGWAQVGVRKAQYDSTSCRWRLAETYPSPIFVFGMVSWHGLCFRS